MRRKHHDLHVWQEAMELVQEVYEISAHFPQAEVYALTSQMRRSAVSVPSNIAEGAARNGNKEFLHFLSIARGSLSELETQVQVAHRLGYMSERNVFDSIDKVFGLLGGLINSLKNQLK